MSLLLVAKYEWSGVAASALNAVVSSRGSLAEVRICCPLVLKIDSQAYGALLELTAAVVSTVFPSSSNRPMSWTAKPADGMTRSIAKAAATTATTRNVPWMDGFFTSERRRRNGAKRALMLSLSLIPAVDRTAAVRRTEHPLHAQIPQSPRFRKTADDTLAKGRGLAAHLTDRRGPRASIWLSHGQRGSDRHQPRALQDRCVGMAQAAVSGASGEVRGVVRSVEAVE